MPTEYKQAPKTHVIVHDNKDMYWLFVIYRVHQFVRGLTFFVVFNVKCFYKVVIVKEIKKIVV